MKQEFSLCWFKLIASSHTVVKVFLMICHSFPTKIFSLMQFAHLSSPYLVFVWFYFTAFSFFFFYIFFLYKTLSIKIDHFEIC